MSDAFRFDFTQSSPHTYKAKLLGVQTRSSPIERLLLHRDLDYIETFPSTHSSSNHSLLAWSPQITSTLIACSSYSHIFKSMTWSPSLLLVAPFSRQRSQDFTADSSSDSIKQSAIPRCVTMVPPLYILLSLTFCQQRSYHPLPRCWLIPICHYMSVA